VHRFLADDRHFGTIADGFGVLRTAVHHAVHAGVDAIVAALFTVMVRWPDDDDERTNIRTALYAMHNMPCVAGMCARIHVHTL
jgi:hypothetical protein